jgi:hypothetical protein
LESENDNSRLETDNSRVIPDMYLGPSADNSLSKIEEGMLTKKVIDILEHIKEDQDVDPELGYSMLLK